MSNINVAQSGACPWCREHGMVVCVTVNDVRVLAINVMGQLTVYDLSLLPRAIQGVKQITSELRNTLLRCLEEGDIYAVMTGAIAEYVRAHGIGASQDEANPKAQA
jgi:hypothetical protein